MAKKKILGLVASYRKMGNSELLLKEIMDNVPEDSKPELLRLTDLKIETCKACYHCLREGNDCKLKDDFNFVMKKIHEADAVLIGVPVYLLGPQGSYKMLNDRLVGAYHHSKFTAGKPCAIVIPYGAEGWQGYSKAAALVLPRLLEMKLVDCWQVHTTLPGEFLLDEAQVHYARQLGRELFSSREYRPGVRECACCGSDLFRLLPGNGVECCICNTRAYLGEDNVPIFEDSPYRFSHAQLEEHLNGWVVGMKQKFREDKDRLKEASRPYKNKDYWIR